MTEQEKIAQLQEVCGIEEEVARHLLEASQWNVEEIDAEPERYSLRAEALHLHFSEGAVPAASTSPSSRPLSRGGYTSVGSESAAASGTPTHAQERSGFFGAVGKVLAGVQQAVLGVSSEDFEQWFLDRYGQPTPRFCKCTFGDTVQRALSERKLVLAWFHQEENAATEKFCRPGAERESFLLWAGDVGRFEPSQVARLLGLQKFPALVVLQPVTNGFQNFLGIEWPLGTFCQPMHRCVPEDAALDSDMVVATITMTAMDFREEVQNLEEQQTLRDLQLAEDRRLREQQDREYEEGLLADQLAAIRSQESSPSAEAEAAKAKAEAEAAAKAEAEAAAKAEAAAAAKAAEAEAEEEAKRQSRAQEILAQPEPQAAANATARIRVQLPSGERLQRTFQADQTLAQGVYEWAHCCRPVAQPKRFELCISFPARSLQDRSATLKDLELVPSAALVLKEVE
ncbi:unnamed protein product [Effrenium voratum]|nr:unnamed protein product [Effrenium voratum]